LRGAERNQPAIGRQILVAAAATAAGSSFRADHFAASRVGLIAGSG